MHKNIDKIKKLESPPQVIKNLFNKNEIEKLNKFKEELENINGELKKAKRNGSSSRFYQTHR